MLSHEGEATILVRAVYAKVRQALTRLHKWPLLSKSRRGIFNARNDFSACCVRQGETGIDKTAQVPPLIKK